MQETVHGRLKKWEYVLKGRKEGGKRKPKVEKARYVFARLWIDL